MICTGDKRSSPLKLALIVVLALTSLASLGVSQARAQQLGDDFYCAERNLGRWFYCEPPQEEDEEPEAAETAAPASPPADAEAALAAEARAFMERLENARLIAAYDPTPERIETYLRMQWQATENADRFSRIWQETLWNVPSLDYTVQFPVTQYGRHQWDDVRQVNIEATLDGIGERFGIFYFFRSDCPYCHRFNPVLADFAQRNSITIQAVSVDGGPNEVFQDYRINQGQFERLLEGESAVVPAVMLLDTFTNEHHWVSFGLISQDELASRIHRIVSNIEGEGAQ